MSKTHLQTAHEYGVNEALKKLGYASVADVEKQAAELGLTAEPEKTATPVENVFAQLAAKLGK